MSRCRSGLSPRKCRVWAFYGLITVSLFTFCAYLTKPAFAQNNDNGIVIGPAKLYDERSLESQLDSIKSGLTANYVNPNMVATNEGVPQGGTLSSSQITGGIGYNEKPSVSNSQDNSSGTTNTGSKSGNSPISQNFSGSAIGLQSPLVVSSEDLLQQQVGLSFEATNLQLLLDHALSDRVMFAPDGTPAARQMAILGFQISVEPRQSDEYAVAEADITISDTSGRGRPEVDMMLPQDKTYNVAKVTNDSNAFNLGAFTAPLGAALGGNSGHSSSFIVYDVDTVALQRPSPDSKSVTFGWQFRPVLGEKTVQPGTRQVYVLVSLPVDSNTQYTPNISVQTYWRKYDTKAKVVENDRIDSSGGPQLLPTLPIYPIVNYDKGLQPTVTGVETYDAGNGRVLVEATGTNFSDSTSVVAGGQIINKDNGLLVKGGNTLTFIAPLSNLAYEDPLIVGQYGTAIPMRLSMSEGQIMFAATPYAVPVRITRNEPGEGISIPAGGVQVVPVNSQNSDLKITLVSLHPDREGKRVAPLLPSNAQLIIQVGNQTFGMNDHPVGMEVLDDQGKPTDPSQASSIVLDAIVDNSDLQSAQKVTVRYAFCGDDYRADAGLPQPFGDDIVVSEVGQDPTKRTVTLAIRGRIRKDAHAHIAGKDYWPTEDPTRTYLTMAPASSKSKHGPTEMVAESTDISSTSSGFAMSRGAVVPYAFNAPLVPAGTYTLALIEDVPQSDLNSQADMVLYQAGDPPCVVSIKQAPGGSARNAGAGPNSAGATLSNGWVVLAPVTSQTSPTAPQTGQGSAGQPAVGIQIGTPTLEIVTGTANSSSSGSGSGSASSSGSNAGGKGGGSGAGNGPKGPGKGSSGGKPPSKSGS